MNLQTEDQVDLIMRLMPNLEYLNGLPVERDGLDEEAEGQSPVQIAVADEARNNGPGQVQERPGEEDS